MKLPPLYTHMWKCIYCDYEIKKYWGSWIKTKRAFSFYKNHVKMHEVRPQHKGREREIGESW